jgi:hypothetical protein
MNNVNIESLILAGAIEVAAWDAENNEFLYTFTPKLKEVLPELYEEHTRYVNSQIMYFWEMGFVNFNNIMDENPTVCLTDKAFDEDAINSLSDEDKTNLLEIKRILKVV